MRFAITGLLAIVLLAGCATDMPDTDSSPAAVTRAAPEPTLPSGLFSPHYYDGLDHAKRGALEDVLYDLRVRNRTAAVFTADGQAIALSGHFDLMVSFLFHRRIASLAPLIGDAPKLVIPGTRGEGFDLVVYPVAGHFLAVGGGGGEKDMDALTARSLRQIESILAEPAT